MLLLIVIITSFITAFMGSALNLAIPDIGVEFEAGAAVLSWVATGFLLSTAAFTLPFGKLSDQVGKKYIFVIGIFFFGLSSFLTIFANSMGTLIMFRVLGGFFSAMIFSTNVAMLVDSVPPQKRGSYVGFSTAAVYVGLSVGPVLGGFLNAYAGWRSIFIVSALISLVVGILSLKYLENKKPSQSEGRYDLVGGFLYIIMIVLFLSGMSSLSETAGAKWFVVASVLLAIGFTLYERRRHNALLPVELLGSNRIFLFSNLATLIHYAATFGIGYLLSLYLQTVLSLSSDLAGMILLSQPVMMALLSPYTGKLSDRLEPRPLSSIGMGLTALGLLVFALFTGLLTIWLIVLNLILIGVGFAFFSSPNTNAVMGSVTLDQTGVASSTLATMRNIGQALGMAIITMIIAMHAGSLSLSQINPAVLTAGLKQCFLIFFFAACLAIFFSLSRGKRDDTPSQSS